MEQGACHVNPCNTTVTGREPRCLACGARRRTLSATPSWTAGWICSVSGLAGYYQVTASLAGCLIQTHVARGDCDRRFCWGSSVHNPWPQMLLKPRGAEPVGQRDGWKGLSAPRLCHGHAGSENEEVRVSLVAPDAVEAPETHDLSEFCQPQHRKGRESHL